MVVEVLHIFNNGVSVKSLCTFIKYVVSYVYLTNIQSLSQYLDILIINLKGSRDSLYGNNGGKIPTPLTSYLSN